MIEVEPVKSEGWSSPVGVHNFPNDAFKIQNLCKEGGTWTGMMICVS